jgi:hypothetical protein
VLLLPTGAYTIAGCLAVAATIVLAFVLPERVMERIFNSVSLGPTSPSQQALVVTQSLGLILLLWLIYTGLTGPRDPLTNLLVLSVWTIWWTALITLQGVFGDLWRVVNPAQAMVILIGHERRALPTKLGYWIAIFLFICFSAFSLGDIAPDDPARLANAMLIYGALTALGVAIFGQSWVDRAEFVTVTMRFFAQLAPFARGRVGVFGWQVMQARALPVSLGIFAVIFLAVGSFDGLNETFWWLGKIGINPLEFPGRSAVIWPARNGILGSILLLLGLVWGAVALGSMLAGQVPDHQICARFALTLLPIGFGYHVAHFLPSFLVNGQYALAALNDPLASGADLFGMGRTYVTTGFFNTQASVKLIWLTQAGAVVAAHIIGVLMAHRTSQTCFGPGRASLIGQAPFGVLMLGYTWFGLWLLSAPRGL